MFQRKSDASKVTTSVVNCLKNLMVLIMCKKKRKKRKKLIGPKLAQVFERRINCNIFTRKKL